MLRTIALPAVAAAEPCPISPIVAVPADAGFGSWAFDSHTSIGLAAAPAPADWVSQAYRKAASSSTWTVKALWYSSDYDGAVLIRGRRLDGDASVGFELGGGTGGWLLIPPGPTINTDNGYRTVPSAIAVTSAGCYGFQIDTPSFSTTIVIQVALHT